MSRVRTAFPRSSEITPRDVFDQRRSFLRDAGFVIAAAGAASLGLGARDAAAGTFSSARKGPYGTTEAPTPLKDVTSYNNFYEFGTGKEDPAERAGSLKTRPWTVSVEGECAKPRRWDIDELLKLAAIEKNADGVTVNRWNTTGFLASSAAGNEAGYLTSKILRNLGVVALDTQARI